MSCLLTGAFASLFVRWKILTNDRMCFDTRLKGLALFESCRNVGYFARFVTLAAVCMMAAKASGIGVNELPSAPLEPSAEDCRQLASELYAKYLEVSRSVTICMRQEPRFGFLPLHRGICRDNGLTAWIQCSSLTDQQCDISEYNDRQNAVCSARAQKIQERKNAEARLQSEKIAKLAAFESRFKKVQATLLASSLLIRSPPKFLQKALGDTSKAVLERINPGLRKKPIETDSELAQQIYKQAFDSAHAGRSSKPVIGEIQDSALQRIDQLYGNVFSQMDDALKKMDALQIEGLQPNFFELLPAHEFVDKPKSKEDPECKVLDDFNSAGALRDADPTRFSRLMHKCLTK